jgi:hypothetical protein
MNLFDYIKWRTENKQKVEANKKVYNFDAKYEKLQMEVGELDGEISGLYAKKEILERASRTLLLSNHSDRSRLAIEIGKQEGRLGVLKGRLARLDMIRAGYDWAKKQ